MSPQIQDFFNDTKIELDVLQLQSGRRETFVLTCCHMTILDREILR